MLVKVDVDRRVQTHPIAGTRLRGKTPKEDEALAKELLADEKVSTMEIQDSYVLISLKSVCVQQYHLSNEKYQSR